jgi:hypothetical protein
MAFTLVWASGRCVKSLRATCGQTGYNEWVGMPLERSGRSTSDALYSVRL